MAGKAFSDVKKSPPESQSSWGDLYYWLRNMNGRQEFLPHDPIVIDDSSLTVGSNWPARGHDSDSGFEKPPTTRMPIPPSGGHYDPAPVSGETWDKFLDHLLDREGYRNTVYRDSLGKPTVGVGHLVKPGDNLQVGETISDEKVRELLESDASKAYKAAVEQANELGINDSDFVVALGSVNYQLGTGWRQKFPQTWEHMKDGNYDQAINNIEGSLWARQTPTRTNDFTAAIRNVAETDHSETPIQTAETVPPPGLSSGPSPA